MTIGSNNCSLQFCYADLSLIGSIQLSLLFRIGNIFICRSKHDATLFKCCACWESSLRKSEKLYAVAGICKIHNVYTCSRESWYGDGIFLIIMLRRRPIVIVTVATGKSKSCQSCQTI